MISQTWLWDFTWTIQKSKPCMLIPSCPRRGRAGLSPRSAEKDCPWHAVRCRVLHPGKGATKATTQHLLPSAMSSNRSIHLGLSLGSHMVGPVGAAGHLTQWNKDIKHLSPVHTRREGGRQPPERRPGPSGNVLTPKEWATRLPWLMSAAPDFSCLRWVDSCIL